ncbi:MAG: polysaccharide lyase family 8 super-sandwich domain-containing protein [Prolixibacteraceae bacterium]
MKIVCILAVSFLFLSNFTIEAKAKTDYQLVNERVLTELLKHQANDKEVEELMQRQNANGSWPGINYKDVSNTGFEHRIHLSNMVEMSTAYSQKSSQFFKNKELKKGVINALTFWCDNDFICENWWYNQIGTPTQLVNVLLLMKNDIDKNLLQRSLQIVNRGNLNASGARQGGDRIKIGGIQAKMLLVAGNESEFEGVMQIINNEIKFTTGDRGMQSDYSFHHRVFRVNNTTSYGLSYAGVFAEWAAYVAGTKYAFSIEKLQQLINYYLDGICKQMVYGVYRDPGVLNRDITRKEGFRPEGTEIPERLLLASNYRNDELKNIIALRQGDAQANLSFGAFFWQTEHFAFQRPNFYTSVRMNSVRNRNMEQPYNSEGLFNHHRADGANFLSKKGNEYLDIWPVYDWQKIPGTTVLYKPELPSENEIQKRGLTEYVGAVTDGKYGAVGFDFISPHDFISARKAWFFFDDEYVCLGAGIKSDASYTVITTIDQALLKSDVIVNTHQDQTILTVGDHEMAETNWVLHNEIGFIFPEHNTIHVSNKTQSGSWYNINKQWSSSKETVTENVFSLWIDHGVRPQGKQGGLVNQAMLGKDVKYAYIVVPNASLSSMNNERGIKILINSRNIQAVQQRNLGITQFIFYKGGTVQVSENFSLTCDSQGAIMLKLTGDDLKEITVADPSRQLSQMHLRISGEVKAQNEQGFQSVYDAKANLSYLSIELPEGDYAGKSVSFTLQ